MKDKDITSKALEKYNTATSLRAAIQIIPYVGGAIDTLMGGYGSKIQEERLKHFLDEIKTRIELLETKIDLEPTEELFDFLIKSFDAVIKTRSETKRKRFAEIFSKQVAEQNDWEEAEAATRFLHELTELHVLILEEAITTHPCSEPFDNLRVISLIASPYGSDTEHPPKILSNTLTTYSILALKMGCAELIAKGLLLDEGVGRLSTKAMQYLTPTDLADWFINWIKENK